MQKKVLIADDEPYILQILAMKLRHAGYDVFTACDGEEAMSMALATRPDLIITDYQMPYMNGLQFYQSYCKQINKLTPVVLVTAREFDLDPEELAEIGIFEVMGKPFSPRQVVESVERLLTDSEKSNAGAA